VPIIFRPFHEHNGGWFWWGKGNCTEQEYIQLWRFTVTYLKNEKKLHHLIYAFSPDRSGINLDDAKASYLYAYPGDEYVDVIGLDNYMDVGISWNKKTRVEQKADFVKVLGTLSELANEKNKIAALTETGQEGLTNKEWFTQVILNPLKENPNIQLAYFMMWRNANVKHHYAPFTGHPAAADFVRFYNDPYTLFEADLQNIYKFNKPLTK
jgi:mannan endo-1,4-beta-mannosidase